MVPQICCQGYAPAQNQLGSMYENNIGVPQNYKSAAAWYRLAANQGFAAAQYNLASVFEAGHGVHRKSIMCRRCLGLTNLQCKVIAMRKISSAGCISSDKELRPTMPRL